MATIEGRLGQETCHGLAWLTRQSAQVRAMRLVLTFYLLVVAGAPAVRPGVAGQLEEVSHLSMAEVPASEGAQLRMTCMEGETMIRGKLVTSATDQSQRGANSAFSIEGVQGGRGGTSSLAFCPANASYGSIQEAGVACSLTVWPSDIFCEKQEVIEGQSVMDSLWEEHKTRTVNRETGRIASASLSVFDWGRRKLMHKQLGLRGESETDTVRVEDAEEGLPSDSRGRSASVEKESMRTVQRVGNQGIYSTAAAEAAPKEHDTSQSVSSVEDQDVPKDAKASQILRLKHRAKTEDPAIPSPSYSSVPPTTRAPFSSVDHEHLLAADAVRRGLISSSKISLGGSTVPLGYYFAEMALGTPPQRFQMIVDTGSAIMYVPAKECASCGKSHESSPYDHEASSTYAPLLCSSATCAASTPATCPSPSSPCLYQQHYSEGSSTSGTVAIDVVSLPGVLGSPRIMFGCETLETGLLYTQTADGIIGLGRGPGSVIAQLAQQRVVDDAFSLCFGGVEGGGAMVLGSVGALPGTVWVPMLPQASSESMYFAELYGFKVGGSAVHFDPESVPVSAMIDSGTTYTYLPSTLYAPLVAQLLQAVTLPLVPVPKRSLAAACWGKVTTLTGPSLPTLSFVFANGSAVEVPPDNYLFKHPTMAGSYCLGVFSSGQHGATIGGISVHNLLVTYDRAHQLLGFAPLNCSAVADGSLTLPKPQTSFPNLDKQRGSANTSTPTYARIPFRTTLNASSVTSARARDPVPNPWATLEGPFVYADDAAAPAPAPGDGPPGTQSESNRGTPPLNDSTTVKTAGSPGQGMGPVTGASSGHLRQKTLSRA